MSAALLIGTPLAGRVAVVSGASSGMGAVTAQRLAELGATVVVLARRKDKLDGVVKAIEAAGGTALALAVDVTDRATVQSAAERRRAAAPRRSRRASVRR
ncbi:SDR family NAD(P)-dependent oxidoreductase [Streptomyces sp. NPDC002088]|uniref:SDR family NAD(P)-dependent oxidoreductase n=1 Tax=Streptomyces sp. NPDC002088 TaxID=3154665 RepID=UPI003316FBF7